MSIIDIFIDKKLEMNDFEHYPKAIRNEIEQMVFTVIPSKKKKNRLYRRIKLCTKILIKKSF